MNRRAENATKVRAGKDIGGGKMGGGGGEGEVKEDDLWLCVAR